MKIKFPHITRKITALGAKHLLNSAVPAIMMIIIIANLIYYNPGDENNNQEDLAAVLGLHTTQSTGVSQANSSELTEELNNWLNIQKYYPDYNYSYLKLAEIYSRLNNQEKSKIMLKKYKEKIIEEDNEN